jgi:adenine-specific DNA-methyltransferase
MPKSLLEQLPEIVANGRREAERILESIESRHRVQLQTREIVLPAKDAAAHDWITQQQRQAQQASAASPAPDALWHNRLIYGDNLLAMAALLAGDEHTPSLRGKVDLIYIDPPFDSKADYRTKVVLPGVELEQKPTVIEQFAYSDTWSDGTASYLAMMTPRLILMRELLADTGSIYVHLDWHVGHYVKVVMDEVFGRDSFTNEIIWKRQSAHSGTQQCGNVHDTLFLYRKNSDRFTWNTLYTEPGSDYIDAFFDQIDAQTGRRYARGDLTGAGITKNGESGKPWRGIDPSSKGRHWALSHSELDRLDEAGKIHWPMKGVPRLKRYIEEFPGVELQDVWTDIKIIHNQSDERVQYSTQKPESLLERVILSACPENGLVADFNGGSGTTAAVAEKLGRRWITTDLGKPACMIMRKRLIDQDAQPFLYQAIGDYQVEAARASLGRDFRIGDLSQIVLSLYGALALSVDDSPQRNLGFVTAGGFKTLVLADSPNKLTGTATLKKAIAQRDNLLGGWDKVVVLGWNFEPSIGETITALNDARLEVLVIPPDLMDRLKKKGGLEKLRGSVRFSSLQYLTIYPVERTSTQISTLSPTPLPSRERGIKAAAHQGGGSDAVETLTVRLKNYVLLSPEAINLDEANRAKLQAIANAEPLALIEYWAVDPDYDGRVFRSVWQDYRGNTANDGDALRVVAQAVLTAPAKADARRVCVRVVDVFGFEAEVVATVEAV